MPGPVTVAGMRPPGLLAETTLTIGSASPADFKLPVGETQPEVAWRDSVTTLLSPRLHWHMIPSRVAASLSSEGPAQGLGCSRAGLQPGCGAAGRAIQVAETTIQVGSGGESRRSSDFKLGLGLLAASRRAATVTIRRRRRSVEVPELGAGVIGRVRQTQRHRD